MTRDLTFKRRGAAQGRATSLVVLVHGYGANGDDLLDLSGPLGAHLPGAAFVAPDAHEPCNGFGYQWFSIPRFDGSSEAQARAGLLAAADDLNAFLDARLQDEGLGDHSLALFGFSQGAMMSLHIAPRRAAPVAAVVACSGRLLLPETLAAQTTAKPPVLLMHGDQDPVVPFADMSDAGDALVTAGFQVYAHVMQGTGHGIAPDGLGAAVQFLRETLPA